MVYHGQVVRYGCVFIVDLIGWTSGPMVYNMEKGEEAILMSHFLLYAYLVYIHCSIQWVLL